MGAMAGSSGAPLLLEPLQCPGSRGPGSELRHWGPSWEASWSWGAKHGSGSKDRLLVSSLGLEEEGPGGGGAGGGGGGGGEGGGEGGKTLNVEAHLDVLTVADLS